MSMEMEILMPFRVYDVIQGVERIVVETQTGSYGLLPHRRDCVAILTPGILTYQCADAEGQYVALDEGVLVKRGAAVTLSVRNAIAGDDLTQLRAAVEHEFKRQDEHERSLREVVARLESGFVQRFREFRRG
ncbi:F0F1 ATP synthase subunit epsilon [Marinobacteraceae bacterium S3BR75-40.1]